MGILTIKADGRTPKQVMEDRTMPAIVEFPTVVAEALTEFGDQFANEPERRHFAEYLTGLFVAERKNVSAISRQFAQATDQSCLNRWLTEVHWDVEALNRRRLDWLQREPSTRTSAHGVIALDNVLIDHEGKLIEDVGWFWDHAEQRHKIAHDYLIANYVCPGSAPGNDAKHYPLDFRRFVKREQCELEGEPFVDHNALFRELVDWVINSEIPGDFAFDSWFTHAANLNHIHGHDRGYVGDLKFNRKVIFKGRTLKAEQLAALIGPEDRKVVEIDGDKQWCFTKSVRLNGVDHRVRIVILWKRRNGKSACKILITNRTHWEVGRVLRTYRHRWRGTECFHRDGKQHLGMGDCQLRKGRGQTRHMYLVFLAHSVLMRQLRQRRARRWALQRLTTIGQACMAVARQTLGGTIDWVIDRVREDGWNSRRIKAHLALL
jgi:DDE superfamily endonuclease